VDHTPIPDIYDKRHVSKRIALKTLEFYLRHELAKPSCISPFSEISMLLGCLPTTQSDFIINIRSKIRHLVHGLVPSKLRHAKTYEHLLTIRRKGLVRTLVATQIAKCHVLYAFLRLRDWEKVGSRGSSQYHVY